MNAEWSMLHLAPDTKWAAVFFSKLIFCVLYASVFMAIGVLLVLHFTFGYIVHALAWRLQLYNCFLLVGFYAVTVCWAASSRSLKNWSINTATENEGDFKEWTFWKKCWKMVGRKFSVQVIHCPGSFTMQRSHCTLASEDCHFCTWSCVLIYCPWIRSKWSLKTALV